MLHDLSKENSIVNQFMAEIRDAEIQKDSMRFRKNMARVGEILAYEISKTLEYETKEITTPLGISKMSVLKEQPVLATILRAGLALHDGLLNYYDKSDCAFISAYRKHEEDGSFKVEVEYMSCPDLENRVVIVSDPMLATGSSMVLTLKHLFNEWTPKKTIIATAIASTTGIDHVLKSLANTEIWTAAVDQELTAKYYIVPGLGDAGDLAYGPKMQE